VSTTLPIHREKSCRPLPCRPRILPCGSGGELVALFLLLVPAINLIAFYIGKSYLLGREYFEMVAMRHLPPEEARNLRKANMTYVFMSCGLFIAGFASVPILNLLTPPFATSFMVHIYKSLSRRAVLASTSTSVATR
jgi:CysZ protein